LIHGELARNCHCTITHKHGLALSAVSFDEAIFLGIDIESLTDKPLLLRKAFSTRADSVTMTHDLREKYCILWSCKEAVSKAFGKGMTMDFKKIIISSTLEETYHVYGYKPYRIAGRYAAGKDSVLSLCHIFPAFEPRYEMHVQSRQMASLMNLLDEDGQVRRIARKEKDSLYLDRPLFQADKGKVGQMEGVP
jgi:phosphopantetheinyl transferase (holo-ACP synthase)